jgi:hypothetical protein
MVNIGDTLFIDVEAGSYNSTLNQTDMEFTILGYTEGNLVYFYRNYTLEILPSVVPEWDLGLL